MELVSTLVLVTHWMLVIGLSLRVVSRRAPVGVAVAWIAVMFSLPFAGAGLYLLFGEKRLGRRRAASVSAQVLGLRRWHKSLAGACGAATTSTASAEALAHLAERTLGLPPLAGNELELLDDFQAVFDAIVADIDSAQQSCHVSFYIWHEGGRAIDVIDALVRASRRGVRCKALADAMGSKRFLRSKLAAQLRDGGVELRAALPTSPLRMLFARADLRNHRKIVVIDGRIAYTGSQNLVDPRYFMQQVGAGEWVDAMVRVTGPAVAALDGVFQLDWAVENGSTFESPKVEIPSRSADKRTLVQVAPSGPDLSPEAIHQLLLTAIYGARRELVMTTPYFIPDESILTALLSAALRGVEVTLIVPARNNSLLVRHASVAHFDDLLTAGVRIALFEGGLLHTKSLAIDGETAIFGSVNLDMRSLWLNFEISLLVYDENFTLRLRALHDEYLDSSQLLDQAVWRRRPKWRHFVENAFRLLGPLL